MPSVVDALNNAIVLHHAGRRQEAVGICEHILSVDQACADAWHLRGVIANDLGQNEIAVQSIGRALELRPNWPEALSNLGNAFVAQGKRAQAADYYLRAIKLDPNFVNAH